MKAWVCYLKQACFIVKCLFALTSHGCPEQINIRMHMSLSV